MDDNLTLRAFREEDLGFLDKLCTDPATLGGFEWFGFRDVRTWRRRWEQDGFVAPDSTALAVVLDDGTLIGIASWKAARRGGSPGVCLEIGLALLPDRRAGIVVLANGDAGSRPIDAVVQQWLALAAPNQTHARLRTAMLAILIVAAAAALGLAKRRRTQRKPGDRQRP